MCEYIIPEDFNTDKYIYDESNGLWYELQGEYYLAPIDFLYCFIYNKSYDAKHMI